VISRESWVMGHGQAGHGSIDW